MTPDATAEAAEAPRAEPKQDRFEIIREFTIPQRAGMRDIRMPADSRIVRAQLTSIGIKLFARVIIPFKNTVERRLVLVESERQIPGPDYRYIDSFGAEENALHLFEHRG